MRSLVATPLEDITEKEWQSQVLELSQTFGWRHFHPFYSKRSPHGFPDLVLVRDRVVFVELKREKTKPTADQQAWIAALLNAGAETYIARPRHLDQLARVLAHRGNPFQARGDLRDLPDIAARLREETRACLNAEKAA